VIDVISDSNGDGESGGRNPAAARRSVRADVTGGPGIKRIEFERQPEQLLDQGRVTASSGSTSTPRAAP